jgi:uncharacterized membrane protein
VLVTLFNQYTLSPATQQPLPSIVLAILLGAVFDTTVVLVITYLLYLRDAKNNKLLSKPTA